MPANSGRGRVIVSGSDVVRREPRREPVDPRPVRRTFPPSIDVPIRAVTRE